MFIQVSEWTRFCFLYLRAHPSFALVRASASSSSSKTHEFDKTKLTSSPHVCVFSQISLPPLHIFIRRHFLPPSSNPSLQILPNFCHLHSLSSLSFSASPSSFLFSRVEFPSCFHISAAPRASRVPDFRSHFQNSSLHGFLLDWYIRKAGAN